jgi:hypothetical protein
MIPEDSKQVGAAYVGWTTFKKALEQLAEAGVPNQIDKSVFQGQSWGVQAQLVTGFKFLGLTDDAGLPTAALVEIAVPDEQKRIEGLRKVFRERYGKLFALDLAKATPSQLDQAIGLHYGVSGDTKEKAIRFFLSAAAYLGIPLSTHLKPKATNGKTPRRRRAARRKGPADAPADSSLGTPPAQPIAGETKVFKLHTSGATLTIALSQAFIALAASDRKFVFDLMDSIEQHELKSKSDDLPSGQSQTDEGAE